MTIRLKLAAVAGLAVLFAGLPARAGERVLGTFGGWEVVERFDDDDWLGVNGSDCTMRHVSAPGGMETRIELLFPGSGRTTLTVETLRPADGIPGDAMWPAGGRFLPADDLMQVQYGRMGMAFSDDGDPSDVVAYEKAFSLRYDVLGGGNVRVRAGFDMDAEVLSGVGDAGYLHLWRLGETTREAVGYSEFDLGQAAPALVQARRCRG